MSEERGEGKGKPVIVDAGRFDVEPGEAAPLVSLGDVAEVFGFDVPEMMRGVMGTIGDVKVSSSCATPVRGKKV